MGKTTLKVRNMFRIARVKSTRSCSAFNCEKGTTGGKPFCANHVLEMPYVQSVLAGLTDRDCEAKGLGKNNYRLPMVSILADEVIQLLKQLGGLSIEGAARDLRISRTQMGHLAATMKWRKIIRLWSNTRGTWIMELL